MTDVRGFSLSSINRPGPQTELAAIIRVIKAIICDEDGGRMPLLPTGELVWYYKSKDDLRYDLHLLLGYVIVRLLSAIVWTFFSDRDRRSLSIIPIPCNAWQIGKDSPRAWLSMRW